MANVGYAAAASEMREAQAAARVLGLEVATFEIRRPEDITPAFDALKGRADAIYICTDALINANCDEHRKGSGESTGSRSFWPCAQRYSIATFFRSPFMASQIMK
jgi:hypothetical protein